MLPHTQLSGSRAAKFDARGRQSRQRLPLFGQKTLQRGGLPLPTPHSGSRQNASSLNQRKFIHPSARAGKNKTGGTIYGNEIQKSGCSLPRDPDLLLDVHRIDCGKRYEGDLRHAERYRFG